ncbi:Mini-ribonuclease 3 [Lapidilactobacillus bayanensis]|uniref:Mini-ribonuclease 3 n=1 Tax=Lapidilactobacillus bayanensis TaxID=2485998 RepID=UPI0013DE7120|nr:Mini-ribonuclease 3 [Lapidilactobacillus bayanensis]
MSSLADQLNGIALAYLGDSVYEVFVREHLLTCGVTRPNQLQRQAVAFVSAKAQAKLIQKLQDGNQLTERELLFYHRGRNAKSYTKAKHTDVITYRMSTGFEAVFGSLKLDGQSQRIDELAHWCIAEIEKEHINGNT